MRFCVLCFSLFAVALSPRLIVADQPKSEGEEKVAVGAPALLAKGKSAKITRKGAVVVTAKVTDEDGKLVAEEKNDRTMARTYVEKTLSVDDKAKERTEYVRSYQKARDVVNEEATNRPYGKRDVRFTKSRGKWKVSAEGKPALGDDDLKELLEEVNKDDSVKREEVLYPKGRVKVGEKWSLVGKDVAKLMEDFQMDPDSVKAEGKLVRTYRKGKQLWGALEYVITFDCKLGEIEKARGTMKVTLEQALDGTAHAGKAVFEVSVAGKRTVEQNGQKLTVALAVKGDFTTEATEAE